MDKLVGFLGKLLYCVPFLVFGLGHLTNASSMAGMVPAYIPGGVLWIYVTGVAMILAALAILSGKQARNACFGLAAMLLVFMVTIHLPGMSTQDPGMKMMSLGNFLKDLGLMGAALFLATTYQEKEKKA
jgi:putative oxidoreductase